MSVFIDYPRRGKRDVRIRQLIPNIITTAAMSCGLASIHYSLLSDWNRAMVAILFAALLDALDGRAARLLRATSPFGAVLDSLSDFLCFGIAPALLLHEWILGQTHDVLGLVPVVTFVLCSALRLARFTAAAQQSHTRPAPRPAPRRREPDAIRSAIASKFFIGMPTPAAAAVVLVPAMLVYGKFLGPLAGTGRGLLGFFGVESTNRDVPAQPADDLVFWFIAVYVLLISFLMISRLPMFSFKKLRIARRFVVPLLVAVGIIAVLALKDLWLIAATLSLAYLASLPLSIRAHQRLIRASLSETLPEPDPAREIAPQH
ncbi:MAG: phosphatidylcholine/phosphatidylserine synthase [Phycisphaerales bacterium]|nr:phosphatidylcholine/phosphatidylserine synthase [Phycisphaerales bacterium]